MQIKTLYKGPLKLHALGLIRVKGIKFTDNYKSDDIDQITKKYVKGDIHVIRPNQTNPTGLKSVIAGEAIISI